MATNQADFDRKIKQIRKNKVQTAGVVDLNRSGLTNGDIQALADALASNHDVHTLNLSYNNLDDGAVKILAGALAHNTYITTLNITANNISNAGAIAFSEMLTQNTTLKTLLLFKNHIADEGVIALAEALKHNTTLADLSLDENEIGDAGAEALAEIFRTSRTLTICPLWRNNNITQRGVAAIEDAIIGGNNKNMIMVSVEGANSGPIEHRCQENRATAIELQKILQCFFSSVAGTPKDWWEITERTAAIAHDSEKNNFKIWMEKFNGFLDTLPTVDVDAPLTLEMLTTKQGDWAPIDNPRTWQQWDIVVAALNKSGVYLQADTLLEADRKTPTALLQQMIDYGKVSTIFSKANWQGTPRHEINAVLRALPPEIRKTIPNLHVIFAAAPTLSQQATQALG